MTKHTPATWHVNAIKNGRIVGGAEAEEYDKIQINSANHTIATVYRPADAALIARAVNSYFSMRNSLERLVAFHCHELNSHHPEWIEAQAAIAKARGE